MSDGQRYKIFLLLKRREGMSIADFRRNYENVHVPLCLKYSRGVTRYIRNYLDPVPHMDSGANDELPYDVVTELWFDDEEVWKATAHYLGTGPLPEDVLADEDNLFNRASSRAAAIIERVSALE